MTYTAVIFFVVLFYVFFNYGNFAKTVVCWSKPPVRSRKNNKLIQPKCSTEELIMCYIPIFQVCTVRKALYRKCTGCTVVATITSIGIVINLINKFIFAINPLVMLICNVIMLVCTLMVALLYGFVTADCARMYDVGWLGCILHFLFSVLSCWFLRNQIPDKMRALHKEDTFSEHAGDTVIKSKHN